MDSFSDLYFFNRSSTLLPVMVWIYGGGWDTGASKWYDGGGIVAQSVAIVSSDLRCTCFFLSQTRGPLFPSGSPYYIRFPQLCARFLAC